jgi:hypothetical protein
MGFFGTQWNDLKGNAKWAGLVVVGGFAFNRVKHLLRKIPNIPEWAVWLIIVVLSIVVFLWLARRGHIAQQPSTGIQPAAAPALAAAGVFDIDQFNAQV